MNDNIPELQNFLEYEIRASWWAGLIGWKWGQKLAGKYFSWKVGRKYAKYVRSIKIKNIITATAGEDLEPGDLAYVDKDGTAKKANP